MSSLRWRRRGSGTVLAAVVFLFCGACGGSTPSAPATVTVTQSAPAGVSPSGAVGSPSASASGAPSTSASPAPTSTTTLGGTCDTVLPIGSVDSAVGVPVVGKTAFVVDRPDPSVGQVERINCQYGIAPRGKGSRLTDTKAEVSISLYSTDQQAAARVASTESDWRGQGAVPQVVAVAGHAATILIGYGKPLLVLAAGPRTIAVSLTATVVTAARLDPALINIAAAALQGAGG